MQIGPEASCELFARDEGAWFFEQQLEYVKRLMLKSYSEPAIAQFALSEVDLKASKANFPRSGARAIR